MWNINVEPEGEAEKCELLYRINYQSLYIHKKHAAYFELATDNCSSLHNKKKKKKNCIETNDTESLIYFHIARPLPTFNTLQMSAAVGQRSRTHLSFYNCFVDTAASAVLNSLGH